RIQASPRVATQFGPARGTASVFDVRCGDRHGNSFTEEMMEAIIERCAGLDIHQATVVACVLIGQADRKPRKEIRTFSTLTRDLEAMRDWRNGHGGATGGLE